MRVGSPGGSGAEKAKFSHGRLAGAPGKELPLHLLERPRRRSGGGGEEARKRVTERYRGAEDRRRHLSLLGRRSTDVSAA